MILKFLKIVLFVAALYGGLCVLLYGIQEQLIFFPQKLDPDYVFEFEHPYEEIFITATDGIRLHGLLFKADSSKGLVFYLHGNAGSLATWGDVASTYRDLGYDVFILDYRGYGKSEGTINGEEQLHHDIQSAYHEMSKKYKEENFIILGYSLGTGFAAKLAAENTPKMVILQAPFYSMTDLMKHSYPFLPTFILQYKFATNEYLRKCSVPMVFFHGDEDEVIYCGSSMKLKNEFPTAKLILLKGQGHNGMTSNPEYIAELTGIIHSIH